MTTHTHGGSHNAANDNLPTLERVLACPSLVEIVGFTASGFPVGPMLLTSALYERHFDDIGNNMSHEVMTTLMTDLFINALANISKLPVPLASTHFSTMEHYLFSSAKELRNGLAIASDYRRASQIPPSFDAKRPGGSVTLLRMLQPIQDNLPTVIIGCRSNGEMLAELFAAHRDHS